MKLHARLLGATLFLVCGVLNAQQPVIKTETKVVLVDTVVTDKKGTYVRGLTAKDFEVSEDDKKQTITSFSFEGDVNSGSSPRKHYIVLFFDNSTMDLTDQPRARQAAIKFIDANAGSNRMMAVVNFGGTLQVTQNFTENVERLKNTVNGVKIPTASIADAESGVAMSGLNQAAANLGARTMFLAVRSLAQSLASVPGRKTLILLSAGFHLRPEDHSIELNAALEACNRANVAIYAVDARGLVAKTPQKAALPRSNPLSKLASILTGSALGSPITAFQGGSVGLSSAPGGWADPRNQAHLEMPTMPADLNQEVLMVLSDSTGGFAIKDTNDLAGRLAKIGTEQDEYYLLGYTPPESPEGSCHKLHVKVSRGGTIVRSRSAFCNEKSRDILVANPVGKRLEEQMAASSSSNLGASMEVPFFYTSANVARVNLAMEIPGDKLKAEKIKGKLHATINVMGIAYRRDGSVGARFSDAMNLNFDDEKIMAGFMAKPLYYENQFEVAAGEYTLKVVFNTGGEAFGKVEMPLTVDSYDSKQFSLSGLALSRAYLPVTDPRANLAAAVLADRTPLIAEGTRLFPAASNKFKSSDPVALYAEIYEPLLVTPDPAKPVGVGYGIRILDRKSGQEKADTGVLRATPPAAVGNGVVPIAAKVPIGSLAPGAYRLELEVGDNIGKTFKRTADFDIE